MNVPYISFLVNEILKRLPDPLKYISDIIASFTPGFNELQLDKFATEKYLPSCWRLPS